MGVEEATRNGDDEIRRNLEMTRLLTVWDYPEILRVFLISKNGFTKDNFFS